MSKNYTKYNVEGVGENLNKRQLVFTIVKEYVEKNNPSFEDLQKAFPDEVQGSKGFIRKEAEVKDPKRFNMREPLKIKNGVLVVVSNQWGDNIKNFLEVAENVGYKISSNIQEEETTIEEPAQKVEIKGKKEAEEKAKKDAEEKAKKDAEIKAKKEAEAKAKMNVYNSESIWQKLDSAYSLGGDGNEQIIPPPSKLEKVNNKKPITDLKNSFDKVSILNEEIALSKNIFNILIEINKEMTYHKFIDNDKLSGGFLLTDYFFELMGISGNYTGLNNNLTQYKNILEKLSKIDDASAKKKFNEFDNKLDNYDSDFREWLKKAEDNRKDKRKTSDSLKKFQKIVKRFTNIFEEYSYSGWTSGIDSI